jgi:hypothetical protein
VLSQGNVGGWDAREQAVVDHSLRTVAGLLGGLEQHEQGAVPLARVIGHEPGHAEQAGNVDVVTAGVGDRYLAAIGVPCGRGARVIRAGFLFDRQCVHVRPQQHGRPVAVGQHADHAGAPDAFLDRIAVLPQLPGDAAGGAVFLVGQLGVLVQVLVERLLSGLEAVVSGQDLCDTAHRRLPLHLGAQRGRHQARGAPPGQPCQATTGRFGAGTRGPADTPGTWQAGMEWLCGDSTACLRVHPGACGRRLPDAGDPADPAGLATSSGCPARPWLIF